MSPPLLQYEPALILYSRKTWKSKSFPSTLHLDAIARRRSIEALPTGKGEQIISRTPLRKPRMAIYATNRNDYHLYYDPATAMPVRWINPVELRRNYPENALIPICPIHSPPAFSGSSTAL